MLLTAVHQLLVALLTRVGVEKLAPPSVDCTQKVSTSEFAGPLRRNATLPVSVATLIVQKGFVATGVSWPS
jgi:hypothetical protein